MKFQRRPVTMLDLWIYEAEHENFKNDPDGLLKLMEDLHKSVHRMLKKKEKYLTIEILD